MKCGPSFLAILGLGLLLTACAGVHGIKSNDTGGIIPWTPENQAAAFAIENDLAILSFPMVAHAQIGFGLFGGK